MTREQLEQLIRDLQELSHVTGWALFDAWMVERMKVSIKSILTERNSLPDINYHQGRYDLGDDVRAWLASELSDAQRALEDLVKGDTTDE